jgi:hypothetical protein
VARNGPPDDFHNQPTQFSDFRAAQPPPPEAPAEGEPPKFVDPLDAPEPTPWYRKPAALAGWIAAVLILIGLIAFGLSELLHDTQGTGNTPSTSTSTAPSPTTTTTTTPSTSATVEPPAQQPTRQPTRQPTQQQPTHRHHLPPLPSVITIPEVPTVITLPPGLS